MCTFKGEDEILLTAVECHSLRYLRILSDQICLIDQVDLVKVMMMIIR